MISKFSNISKFLLLVPLKEPQDKHDLKIFLYQQVFFSLPGFSNVNI